MPVKLYIGDGVYVSFDGYQILLETERHDQEPGIDRIYLDIHTMNALASYAKKIGMLKGE